MKKGEGCAPRSRGFSLVELMVVVAIISVLCMMAVPAVERVQRRAKSSAIASDFRVFAGAFEAYVQEIGTWPPDKGAGVFPPAMAGRLNVQAWTRTTPMGGKYNWENNKMHKGVRYQAALTIKGTAAAPLTIDVAQMIDLDRVIDDGDLTTGIFQAGAGNIPLFIIQK